MAAQRNKPQEVSSRKFYKDLGVLTKALQPPVTREKLTYEPENTVHGVHPSLDLIYSQSTLLKSLEMFQTADHSHIVNRPNQEFSVFGPQLQGQTWPMTHRDEIQPYHYVAGQNVLTASVSSTLMIHFPPVFFAYKWLYNAILRPPRCRGPVGEGAKRSKAIFDINVVGVVSSISPATCVIVGV
jgi:hypothetical protein